MATATKKPTALKFDPAALEEAEAETDRMSQLRRNGKSRAKVPPTSGFTLEDDEDAEGNPKKPDSPADLLAGVEVVDEKDVEYSKIKRSTHNPRQTFDESLIKELAPNIVTICKLNPLTIREKTFELIDGETRHRAGQVGKAKTLRCKIIRCTDAQAACIRLQTSVQRRDLNPLEKAQALQTLLDQYGYSQRQLAPIVQLQQGSIANLTRLLKLPADWKALVISGEITSDRARDLVPWVDEPAVLKAILKSWKECPIEDRGVAWDELVDDGIYESSEDLSFWDPATGRTLTLHPTDEQTELLRIREVPNRYGRKGPRDKRAFNLDFAREMMQAAKQAAIERQDKPAKKSGGGSAADKPDPKKAAENAKKQKEIFAKKLFRYRTAWYQRQLVAFLREAERLTLFQFTLFFSTLAHDNRRSIVDGVFRPGYHGNTDTQQESKMLDKIFETSESQFYDRARQCLLDFLMCSFEGWHAVVKPKIFEQLATILKITLKADWPKSCKVWQRSILNSTRPSEENPDPLETYLHLLNKSQMEELSKEWGLSIVVTDSMKRSELLSAIAKAGRGKPTPKALLEVKECQL